jgi:hypothetical protein
VAIWAASVRRWLADVVAGRGREDAYLELPWQPTGPRRVGETPRLDLDDPAGDLSAP